MQGFQTIEVNGSVFFEKAAMPGKSVHVGELDDHACFLFMMKGNNLSIEQNGMTGVHASEGIVKRCSRYVSQFVTDDNETFCEGVAIYFYPEFIKKIFKNEFQQFKETPPPSFNTRKVVSNELIQQYIKGLIPYFEVPELMDEELAAIKIKELVRLLIQSENRTSVLDFFSELFASPRQMSFVEVVENNIYNDLSMDQFAFLCNMSLATFKRTFRKQFDTSPAAYIRHQKIAKAKTLLVSTTQQVEEIAYECGFNELSSFSHTFQKVVGVSPTDFRLSQMSKSLS